MWCTGFHHMADWSPVAPYQEDGALWRELNQAADRAASDMRDQAYRRRIEQREQIRGDYAFWAHAAVQIPSGQHGVDGFLLLLLLLFLLLLLLNPILPFAVRI